MKIIKKVLIASFISLMLAIGVSHACPAGHYSVDGGGGQKLCCVNPDTSKGDFMKKCVIVE